MSREEFGFIIVFPFASSSEYIKYGEDILILIEVLVCLGWLKTAI